MILGYMHSWPHPGFSLPRLAIAYGIENASACCPVGRSTASWSVGQTTCSARPAGRGGERWQERWHSRWTLPPNCSARPCETPSSAARSGTLAGRSCLGGLPYATIDELVPRQVLTRSRFSQIKDQITAN